VIVLPGQEKHACYPGESDGQAGAGHPRGVTLRDQRNPRRGVAQKLQRHLPTQLCGATQHNLMTHIQKGRWSTTAADGRRGGLQHTLPAADGRRGGLQHTLPDETHTKDKTQSKGVGAGAEPTCGGALSTGVAKME
jgi:hypothetical protein